MSATVLPVGHARAEVLILGRRIAADLAAEAVDPTSTLPMADRFALASLALAVELEAARRAGVEPTTAEATAILADGLARIEAGEPRYPGSAFDLAVRSASRSRSPACGTGPPSHGGTELGTTVGCFANTFSAASLI